MSISIGIRHEDRYNMERRAPLVPKHVERLVKQLNLDICVQTSLKRIFDDEEYIKAGAKIVKDLKKCDVIFGVKEMPLTFFEKGKTYVFFSHVIKGQKHNMPMLKRMMELKCNLIDYEKVVDEQNKRLIFFGKYAGLAGMINSFWSLGLRLKEQGLETPFLKIKQAHTYKSLNDARNALSEVGQIIAEQGFPKKLFPFTIGFTGYGNVSNGAQEICGLLPVKEISPDKLIALSKRDIVVNNLIYKVVFKEEHLVELIDKKEGDFDLFDYYTHPEKYKSKFSKYIPHLTMIMNGMYWDPKYPRIVTKDYLKKLYLKGEPKLKVIGDISCDVEGSIECTVKATEIEDPIFVWNPEDDNIKMGCKGHGIQIMSVDILPAELPRDASYGFSDVLVNFVKPISYADYSLPYEELDLPRSIKKALILHNGELTHNYEYMKEFLQ